MSEVQDRSAVEVLRTVVPHTGPTLRCKGWKQEGLLRMLENTMANAERPENLVIYSGVGKAARNWESYHAIVGSLKSLEDNETLVIQSGMPVAIFKTHRLAPTVLMANTNILRATWPLFYELQDKNLTMFASYTAGPWQYIGTQGVIQGTFETLAAVADRHYDGDLRGRVLLTAGLGGMGANQPRAMTMHGGICLAVEVNEATVRRRIEIGFCDVIAHSVDEALALVAEAKQSREPLGIGLVGNAAEVFPELAAAGFAPDVVTEMCPCLEPLSYIPAGLSIEAADELRLRDRDEYLVRSRESMRRHLRAMNAFYARGIPTFEYATLLRKECLESGMSRDEAFAIPGFLAEYIRPMFLLGRGPFRWVCLSGSADDLRRLDSLVLEMFPDDHVSTRWIRAARGVLPIEGLPARVCYLGFGQRRAFALRVNELVASGELDGPVAFTRDNFDSGSAANPTFESEGMLDGSDLISDWPSLNVLLGAAGMADLVCMNANASMGESAHTGVTMIADGSPDSAVMLDVSMTVDSGIGVVRHAQAGYELAREVVKGNGPLTDDSIQIPLLWSREATFGPDASAGAFGTLAGDHHTHGS